MLQSLTWRMNLKSTDVYRLRCFAWHIEDNFKQGVPTNQTLRFFLFVQIGFPVFLISAGFCTAMASAFFGISNRDIEAGRIFRSSRKSSQFFCFAFVGARWELRSWGRGVPDLLRISFLYQCGDAFAPWRPYNVDSLHFTGFAEMDRNGCLLAFLLAKASRNLLRVSISAFATGALMILPATACGILADWPAGAIYPVTMLLWWRWAVFSGEKFSWTVCRSCIYNYI